MLPLLWTVIAKTAIEAEEQARATILAAFNCDCPKQDQANQAQYVYHRTVVKRRAATASRARETSTPEFVYRHDMSDYDGSWYSSPYRIVKKTAKRVYVERSHRSWEEHGQVFHDVKTIALDRLQLESTGRAWSQKCKQSFHIKPYEEKQYPAVNPQFLEILGLEVGCDHEAVNTAYRSLAQKFHPDHGGDAEDFKRLQVAYEQALAALKC